MYAVNLIVYNGKAYFPAQARFESGIWVDVDPVYKAELKSNELIEAIEKIIKVGHPTLPDPTQEEWKKRKSPIFKATKARSWKKLAQNGASYSIYNTDDKIDVDMSYTDEKGRWQNDPEKARVFPKGTPLEEIVEVILQDIQSRSEIL